MKYESLELIVQSSEDGTIYDLSNIASSISTSKPLDSSAGKCSFSIDTNKNNTAYLKDLYFKNSELEDRISKLEKLLLNGKEC